jgi:hypothetical protein
MTWVAVAIGGAAVVGAGTGIYGANKTASAQKRQTALGQQQQELGAALYTDSKPLRYDSQIQLDQFLRTGGIPGPVVPPTPNLYGLKDFMNTGTLPRAVQPSALPSVPDVTRQRRGILESQYNVARENTIANAPVRGGTLGTALEQLDAQRAQGVAGLYDAQLQAQYQQDLGAAQAHDATAQRLYGVGLDYSQQQASREGDLRRALFSSASALGTQQAEGALSGLAGASTSYNNVASTALKEQQLQGQSAQGLGSTAALSQYLKKQANKNGTKTGSTGVPYDYGLES